MFMSQAEVNTLTFRRIRCEIIDTGLSFNKRQGLKGIYRGGNQHIRSEIIGIFNKSVFCGSWQIMKKKEKRRQE